MPVCSLCSSASSGLRSGPVVAASTLWWSLTRTAPIPLTSATITVRKRSVPPQNLLRINWTGSNLAWTYGDLKSVLLDPLLSMISSRQLTNQIDYVVLSMDIPYQVVQGGDVTTAGLNSTTAAVFYGFKPDGPGMLVEGYPSCNLPDASSNSYAGSESIFRGSQPLTAATNSFLTMMLTSSNLSQAEAIIDRGVASDSSFPVQSVVLAKTSDVFRNVRYITFDNAIFDTLFRETIRCTARIQTPRNFREICLATKPAWQCCRCSRMRLCPGPWRIA